MVSARWKLGARFYVMSAIGWGAIYTATWCWLELLGPEMGFWWQLVATFLIGGFVGMVGGWLAARYLRRGVLRPKPQGVRCGLDDGTELAPATLEFRGVDHEEVAVWVAVFEVPPGRLITNPLRIAVLPAKTTVQVRYRVEGDA